MPRAERTRRVARLVSVLGAAQKKGCTIGQIQRVTGTSRATAYRDLELLRESGYSLTTTTVNGEARYFLTGSELSLQPMTPKERAAIALAKRALHAVDGTWLSHELEGMLQRAREVEPAESGVSWQLGIYAYDPAVLSVIHEGVTTRRVVRLRYRGANDNAPLARSVHPQRLHIVDQQPYLIAWDEQKRDLRTFKVARVTQAKLLRTRARQIDTDSAGGKSKVRSVKVWQTTPITVRIRIGASVARFVHEWPLVRDQKLEPAPAGAVDVCARVFGLEETLRWVLRWGANARVIEPAALRTRVIAELRGALGGYRDKASHDRETTGANGR